MNPSPRPAKIGSESRYVALLTCVTLAVVSAVAAQNATTEVADATARVPQPPPSQRNFVSCPIVRDTATVPCWLSEHDGELYYLGIQTDISADFDPPYLGHQVLVEGTVSDAPRICGGIVLDPVKVSPRPELDSRCNRILPAEARYTVPFAPRPPGPSGGRLAFEPPPGAAVPAPPPDPDEPRRFVIYYDFDMLIMGRHAGVLGEILAHAEEIGATEIRIAGFAGATLLSEGMLMSEPVSIAEKRAREVATLLQGAGLDEVHFSIEAGADTAADGVDDWRSRRSVVIVSR